jgi:hypothetical protein
MTLAAFLQEPYTADMVEEKWRAYEPAKAEARAKATRRVTVSPGKMQLGMSWSEIQEVKMLVRQQLDGFYRREGIARLEEIAEVERTQVYGGRGSVAIVAPRWRRHRERTALARLLAAVRSAPAVEDMNWWEAFDRSRPVVEERPPPQLEQKALDPDRGPPTSRALADRWARFMHDGECRGERRHQVQKEIVPTGQLNGGVR